MSLPSPPSCDSAVFFSCWKIFSVHFDRKGIWDIQHHHFSSVFFSIADLQVYLLCKNAQKGGFLLHVPMSVWTQR